jgi:hypothetical protein
MNVAMKDPRPPAMRPLARMLPALLFALTAAAGPARAQPPVAVSSPRRIWALDLDGGATRQLDPGHWRAFGRVGAGLARFDGRSLLSATAELGVHRDSRMTLGLAGQLAHVESGLGLTGTIVGDLEHDGFGGGLGASFSFLHAQALWFTRGPAGLSLSFFLRAPLGLLWHVLRGSSR